MKILQVAPVALLVLNACQRPSEPLPDYGTVPDFELTSQNGASFHGRDLAGKIWIADFMFTTCPGPCPRMTSQMHQVQEATNKIPGVRLISFTVDPAHDSPTVLAAYAGVHGANPARWSFLTGPQAELNQLCRYVFKLGEVDGSLQHATRFVLMDTRSRIRGYYDTSETESIPKLIGDIQTLAREHT